MPFRDTKPDTKDTKPVAQRVTQPFHYQHRERGAPTHGRRRALKAAQRSAMARWAALTTERFSLLMLLAKKHIRSRPFVYPQRYLRGGCLLRLDWIPFSTSSTFASTGLRNAK